LLIEEDKRYTYEKWDKKAPEIYTKLIRGEPLDPDNATPTDVINALWIKRIKDFEDFENFYKDGNNRDNEFYDIFLEKQKYDRKLFEPIIIFLNNYRNKLNKVT
jgi:hypothetical protein